MSADLIETLIGAESWDLAETAIEEDLGNDPDDHWLWCRLSSVRYEKRNYEAALECATKALSIVPDCPLALWDQAGALDMLGKWNQARRIYAQLLERGTKQLSDPDEDADECWEGAAWTKGLLADCVFRAADCLAKTGHDQRAAELYSTFLALLDHRVSSIYSRKQALSQLKKLELGRDSVFETLERVSKSLEEVGS
jgi:tetratricopeptide (TPR) repeat protein